MSARRVRVVVADDHPPTRAGVRLSLEVDGFEVCGEASTAAAAVDLAIAQRPDVCLLDVNMPGSGITAAARIRESLPSTAVVMLTVSQEHDDLFKALRAGAVGYLLKDIDPDRLPHALRGVLAGEAALPRGLVLRLMEEFRRRDGAPGSRRNRADLPGADRLTSREWEVLDLMRDGLGTNDIANRLYVSPVTVRTHVSAIIRKLRVTDRDAAVRLFDRP